MDLSHDDVQRLLKLIDEAEHLEAFDLVYGDFRLSIRRHGAPEGQMQSSPAAASAGAAVPAAAASGSATAPAPAAAPGARALSAERAVPVGMVAVRAHTVGTFYRAPSPHDRPFVEVGQSVKAEDTVGLIEVMKCYMPITAGVEGKVAEIWAENGVLVEYDEIVVLIEPEKA